MRSHIIVSVLLLQVVLGCTTTRVKKNPRDCDDGIRYYRPKPYLFIQPMKGESQEYVSISLQYLPDFSEEYAIKVKAGLGINKTKITLKDGWNLTQIDQELDSNVDDNINAVANLVKSIAPSGIGKTADEPGAEQPPSIIRANNVPFGYYESVVSRGSDGKKRLYGWRYVGFYPFNGCPLSVSGIECADCNSQEIYGLVFEDGVMTFSTIQQISVGKNLSRVQGQPAPAPADDGEKAKVHVEQYIKDQAWGTNLVTLSVTEDPNQDIVIVAKVKKMTFTVESERSAAEMQMKVELTATLSELFNQPVSVKSQITQIE